MKRFPSLSLLALVLLCGLTACSKQEEFEYTDDTAEKDKQVPNVVVTDENGNSSAMPAGSTIGVYVIDGDGSVTLQQVEVDENGHAVLPTSNQSTTMIAYTPYQEQWGEEAMSEEKEFTVQDDQSTEAGYWASDLMMGTMQTGETTRAATEGSMTLHHMMAKVAIHIIDETGRVDLTRVATQLIDVNGSVMVDLARQQVTTITEKRTDISMRWEMTTDWRISYYAIVAPQSVTEGSEFFAVTLYGNRENHLIPETATLEGGKTYTINMRLTEHGLIYDGWRITEWDEESERNIDINA